MQKKQKKQQYKGKDIKSEIKKGVKRLNMGKFKQMGGKLLDKVQNSPILGEIEDQLLGPDPKIKDEVMSKIFPVMKKHIDRIKGVKK